MPTKGSNVVSFVARPVPRVAERPAHEPAQSLKVLVVDDSPEDRMMVRMALETTGFVLSEAANGRHALASAKALAPDCMLLDFHLPDLDGPEVLDGLRLPNGDMPFAIVVLTGADSGPTAARLLNAGALDYLTKQNLNYDGLRRSIVGSVERFRLIREHRALQVENSQLAAIVNASNDAIVSVTPELVVRTWNPGATAMFGYTDEEAKGRTLDELIVPEDLREGQPEHYRAIVTEGKALLVEAVRRKKDGVLVPVEINAAPIQDENDQTVAISVMFRDVTERKRAEEHVAFLMREVEHRSKNILATVQGIAQLTQAANYAEFLKLFNERLQALAANHALLHARQWRGTPIEDLVATQLAHFGGRSGDRLTVEGPACLLSPEAAQALGMALHELGTNAAKYGALSNASGRVALSWAIAGEGSDRRFAMSWTEIDGPPVTSPRRAGFGSLVMKEMIESAMRGRVQLDFARAGLRWRLGCPADGVLGSALQTD
jgi:PAS domain S-box-containing protein